VKWLPAIIFMLFPVLALAAPDLGTYRDMEGVRVYQDHIKKNTWYVSPDELQIYLRPDGSPDYALDVYRYHGRKGTADQDKFMVHGVLSVSIDREQPKGRTAAIRKALRKAGIKKPRLTTMPVAGAEIKLMFGDQGNIWQQKSRWGARQLVLPLEPEMTQVLWAAVEKEQTLMSLSVSEQLQGMRLKDKEWQEAQTSLAWILPIDLDMVTHPDKFRKTDLGGRMSHGYTGLDVFCFDFIEELDPQLYAKVVRVAIPTTGRELVEEVTFRDDGEYRSRIDFKLAKGMDWPYRVQVVRVMRDGSRQVGEWIKKQGESILDITAYREPTESSEE
jgi:hypothetical protein